MWLLGWRRGLVGRRDPVQPVTCVSARGRGFLLFLFVSVLLTGPVDNTLENMERAAASLVCGAELAANQTQELMQRAATPLSCKHILLLIPLLILLVLIVLL